MSFAAYLAPYRNSTWEQKTTSGYAMVVHSRPQTLKNTSLWGSPSPQGSYSPYILGDTTRPGHVTCVLVWSKSDRRRLRKTLHKQTNRQTNKQTDKQNYENNGHLAVNQYTHSKIKLTRTTWIMPFHYPMKWLTVNSSRYADEAEIYIIS